MPEPKRTIKDSVFTCLFSTPEYARALYLRLHPEDTSVTEEEVKVITIGNALVNGQYNDLGLQVRDKLIFLMEAQSVFSENIPLRMLMYLSDTYKNYVYENSLSLYREKRVSIPRPELYMVYTGKKTGTPDTLRLSDMYEGPGSVDLTVQVLREEGRRDILGQYVAFSKILDEQVGQHGRTQQALENTIRLCVEENILKSFLESRKKEVVDVMTTLFTQEQVWAIELHNVGKEQREEGRLEGREEGREEGRKEGRQEGREEGLLEGISSVVLTLLETMSVEEVARRLNRTEKEIQTIANKGLEDMEKGNRPL